MSEGSEAIEEERAEPGGDAGARHERRCIGVTVRTPAGAGSAFGVEPDDRAGSLVARAVDRFVLRRQLEPGEFRLGLLRGIEIVDLAEGDELLAAGVEDGDVLHLLSTEPQVDGCR
ncbi:MAG TPA: hypothetical protein VIL36_23580 [Acidimicrobiales bacterium]